MIRSLRARTAAGLLVAAWVPGAFAFALAHPTASDRAVLENALSDEEQRTLVLSLVAGALAAIAALTASLIRSRRSGGELARTLDGFALGGLLLAPFGLYPLYQAHVPEHVLLVTVAAMGLGVALALLAFLDELGPLPANPRLGPWLPLAIVVLAVLHTIALTGFAHASYRAHASGWDLAIYNQVHWNIVDSGIPWSTMYSATESENHYAIHFSPIYHLTALVYALRKSPETLTALQNAALASGALPLFALARRRTASTWTALCFALSYLFNPAVHSIGTYDFHEIAFFVPLVLGVVWALEAARTRIFWMLVVLTLLVREDTALYLLFLAAYLWSTGRRSLAKPLGALAATYLVLVHGFFMPGLRHIRAFPFHDRFLDLQRGDHRGAGAILSTLLSNPLFCIRYVAGSPERLAFVALTWLPVAFLPVRSGRALLLLVPGFFFSLMSSFNLQYSIWKHYTAPFLGFLYYAAVLGTATLRPRARIALATSALVCSLLLSGKYGRYELLNPSFVRDHLSAARARHGETAAELHRIAASVPPEDSVRATNNLLTAVSGRRHAYILPGGPGADWAFIDYRRDGKHLPATFEQVRAILKEHLSSDAYGVVYRDERVVVLRKGADPSGNAAALAAILQADAF